MKSGDLPGQQLEMKAVQYMDKLSPTDRNNMTRLTGSIIEILSEQGLHGAILGVGGVLTKPAPRKDIDYVVMLNMNEEPRTMQYDIATKRMDILTPVVKRIEEESKGFFLISEIVEPRIDHMHEDLGLTFDDGDIQIHPMDGTLIDLIPRSEVSLEKYIQIQNDPFAVLKTF